MPRVGSAACTPAGALNTCETKCNSQPWQRAIQPSLASACNIARRDSDARVATRLCRAGMHRQALCTRSRSLARGSPGRTMHGRYCNFGAKLKGAGLHFGSGRRVACSGDCPGPARAVSCCVAVNAPVQTFNAARQQAPSVATPCAQTYTQSEVTRQTSGSLRSGPAANVDLSTQVMCGHDKAIPVGRAVVHQDAAAMGKCNASPGNFVLMASVADAAAWPRAGSSRHFRTKAPRPPVWKRIWLADLASVGDCTFAATWLYAVLYRVCTDQVSRGYLSRA